VIRCFLTIIACVVPLCAQSWDTLQVLKPGDAVRVVDIGGQEVKGSFSAATPDSLTIQSHGSAQSIEKAKIRLVKVRSSGRRLRNLLIGAGIGVAIGVTADQTIGALLRNENGESNRPLMYIAPVALFGGIGAAIPAYRTIYRAR
jgi:hypothetical protein